MAEGGHARDSVSQASCDADELYGEASADGDESFCEPCKSVDKTKLTIGYCPVCDETLCKNCLDVHQKQKLTRTHAILDNKQMSSRQRPVRNQDPCVQICQNHHPKIIRWYCKPHDECGCGECMNSNHHTCLRSRVQDMSRGFKKTKEFKDIDRKLQKIHTDLKEIDGELEKKSKDLTTKYSNVLQKVATVRRDVNEYLDKAEENIQDEAAQMKTDDETELNALRAEHKAIKAEVEELLQILHESNANVNTLFVVTKQAKQRLKTMEKDIKRFKISQQQEKQYVFAISNEIESIISAKTPLGKLSGNSSQKCSKMTEQQDQGIQEAQKDDLTVTYNRSIDLKRATCDEDIQIDAFTILSPDKMIVTDWYDEKVMLLDLRKDAVILNYVTPGGPGEVTALSSNIIAVVLPEAKKILVLNVTSSFTLLRKIKVNKKCTGIAYKDGKFAVSYSSSGRVDILDFQGKKLHKIQLNRDKDYEDLEPDQIEFGQENETLIVSDYDTDQVNVITFREQILSSYSHPKLDGPQGIAIKADGGLFICSRDSNCIHVVSPHFTTRKIILDNDHHLTSPRKIVYCEVNHALYISSVVDQDQIHVYDLKTNI